MRNLIALAVTGAFLLSGQALAGDCFEWEKINGECPWEEFQVQADQSFSSKLGTGQALRLRYKSYGNFDDGVTYEGSIGRLGDKIIGELGVHATGLSSAFPNLDGSYRGTFYKNDGTLRDVGAISMGYMNSDSRGRTEFRGVIANKSLSDLKDTFGLGFGLDVEGARAIGNDLTLNYRVNSGLLALMGAENQEDQPILRQKGVGNYFQGNVELAYAAGERVHLTAEAQYSEGRATIKNYQDGVTTVMNPSNAQIRVGARVRIGK